MFILAIQGSYHSFLLHFSKYKCLCLIYLGVFFTQEVSFLQIQMPVFNLWRGFFCIAYLLSVVGTDCSYGSLQQFYWHRYLSQYFSRNTPFYFLLFFFITLNDIRFHHILDVKLLYDSSIYYSKLCYLHSITCKKRKASA